MRPWLFSFALLLLSGPAFAGITISSPADGATTFADPCPVPPCRGGFAWLFRVDGEPADSVGIRFTGIPSGSFPAPFCSPPDPIEGTAGCPDLPFTFAREIRVPEGEWDAVVQVTRGGVVEESPPIRLTVHPPNVASAGTISLSRVEPNEGSPAVLLREPGPSHPNGIVSEPSEVLIIGENLDANPYLDVVIAPKLFNEPLLTADSGLPVDEWCRTEAEILSQELLPNGESQLRVALPQIPLELPTRCGFSPEPPGDIFLKDEWRWAIRDRWIRPEREHTWWAIPSQRDVPWQDAPPFRLVKPPYPDIDGFGFRNMQTDASYEEFLSVFGNNAYICVGALGVCATRIPDPLYHLVWHPIYKLAINVSGGSCNGMSATSLLMAREELQPEDFDAAVHFPGGFDAAGNPATYRDTNFCTPYCSPPRPDNLWAHIRKNHGVQISAEYLRELLETLGEAVFDPTDLTSIKGVPGATLERVRSNPLGHVLCFFEPGTGHCVTPYKVTGDRIWVYDNNEVGDETRYIDIVGGDYDYPARRNDGETPNEGNAIMAFPISIWQNGRHLLGLKDFGLLVGDVEFLYMITVGSSRMTVDDGAGGRWGFEDDGTFSDSLPGAVAIPPLGPSPTPVQTLPLLLAMNQPEPVVDLHAEGGRYLYYTGQGGHLLQLEAGHALAGDTDRLQLDYAGGALRSFTFTPERDASRLVPRVGLELEDEESAVFQWLGLEVPAGRSVGFEADAAGRAVGFRNDTGAPTHHLLALDHASGATGDAGRMLYGPFETPPGAARRVVAEDWPEVDAVVAELDLDGDGSPELTEVVTGRPVATPPAPGLEADLDVAKTVAPATLGVGETATYTVAITNAGPETATGLVLEDAIAGMPEVALGGTTHGVCTPAPDGLRCELGELAAGEVATVVYTAIPRRPGTLANAVTVFGAEGDPDLTNNTAVTATRVPMDVDVRPKNLNPIRPGVVPVVIFGGPHFDVGSIDPTSLAFGPGGARPERVVDAADIGGDGWNDLVAHFPVDQAGISLGATTVCVTASTTAGGAITGCDAISTVGSGGGGS